MELLRRGQCCSSRVLEDAELFPFYSSLWTYLPAGFWPCPHLHKPRSLLDSPLSPVAFRFCLHLWLSSLWLGYALVWVSKFIHFKTHQASGINRLIWWGGVVLRTIFSHCFFKSPVFFPCLGNLNTCVLISLIAPHSVLKPFLVLHFPHPPAAWRRSWLCH